MNTAGYEMPNAATEARLNELEAFTELAPAWVRWVNACVPIDAVSFARVRVLTVLQCFGEQTMSKLAGSLAVTPRRVTALVDALEADGFAKRHPDPPDARSTVVSITPLGLKQQALGWQQHQSEVALTFSDLPVGKQKQLLVIARSLTVALKARLVSHSTSMQQISVSGPQL
jgi:DNA-binding MarR family transcriptional regulator